MMSEADYPRVVSATGEPLPDEPLTWGHDLLREARDAALYSTEGSIESTYYLALDGEGRWQTRRATGPPATLTEGTYVAAVLTDARHIELVERAEMRHGEVPLPGPDLREQPDYEEIPSDDVLTATADDWPIHTFVKHPGQRVEVYEVDKHETAYVASVTRGEGRWKDMQTAHYRITPSATIEESLGIWPDAGFEQRDELGEPPAPDEDPFQDVFDAIEQAGMEEAACKQRDVVASRSSADVREPSPRDEAQPSGDGAISQTDIETEVEDARDDAISRVFRFLHTYRGDRRFDAVIDYSRRDGWSTLRRVTEYYDGGDKVQEDCEEWAVSTVHETVVPSGLSIEAFILTDQPDPVQAIEAARTAARSGSDE